MVCYGVIFDVTERKLVEQELSVAAVAFESSSAMVVSDSQQRILRVNQAFVVLTGYAVHEAVGRFSGLLNSGRQDAAFYQAMWQVIGEKGYWEGEIWNRRQNGDVFLDWLSITVVKDAQGCVTNYVSVHSDITLRKRTEEEVHKLAFLIPSPTCRTAVCCRIVYSNCVPHVPATTNWPQCCLLTWIDSSSLMTPMGMTKATIC